MAKIENLSTYLEVKQTSNRDSRNSGVLTSDRYEADSTASQTVINLTFSVTQTAEQIRGFQLYVNGNLLRLGSANDFTFTNITGGVSAQVTLNAPIAAGLNIIALKVGGYQDLFPNPSSVTAILNNDVAQPHLMATAAFTPFIVTVLTTVPYTAIQNRAQVPDTANMLQALMGVERVPCKGINLLQKEFGANGEQVFELENKDARVRFIGNWNQGSDVDGSYVKSIVAGDYAEFTYYGTGFNLLFDADDSAFNVLAYADTVVLNGGTTILGTYSPILGARNYAANQGVNVISSQTLGWHTVKILQNTTVELKIQGFEILNQTSTVRVTAGTSFVGAKQNVLSAANTSAYNAGFSGTKGGRVSKYLLNGAISQVIRECAATPSYLSSADHTNEEVVRRINFREFGANRADDFSTLTTARASAFTLDDGTTTLVGFSSTLTATTNGIDGFYSNTNSTDVATLTFVGTGLDLYVTSQATGTNTNANSWTVAINGGSPQNLDSTITVMTRTIKICSGLPYGTHTVKITRNVPSTFSYYVSDFIIYQPKSPTLPVGAIQIADYNVMANYVANASGSIYTVGTGVLRKNALREVIAVGTWSVPGIDPVNNECGFNHNCYGIGSYIEYSFFGTGVEFVGGYATTQVQNSLITIDGASNLSGFTTSIVQGGSGVTFTPSTGAIAGTASGNNLMRIQISGMSLGWHKIRVTQNTASGQLYVDGFDIITPIHINHPTLRIGSLSLLDNAKIQAAMLPVSGPDLSKAKAWLYFDMANAKILASFNISQVLMLSTGYGNVYFEKPFKSSNYSMSGSTNQVNCFLNNLNGTRGPNYAQISCYGPAYVNGIVSVEFYGELAEE